jgi:hypothetical protein
MWLKKGEFGVDNNLHELTTQQWLAWIPAVYKKGHVDNHGQKGSFALS